MSPIIILDGLGLNNETLDNFLTVKIADIPLFERLMIILESEGFKNIYLLTDKKIKISNKNIQKPIGIKYINSSELKNLDQDLLCFQSNVVMNKKQLSNLINHLKNINTCTNFKFNNKFSGVSFIHNSELKDIETNNVENSKFKDFKSLNLTDSPICLDEREIDTNNGRDFLFNHISKNVSGWVSKNINSKISIPVSKILIKFNIHPNTITFFVGCLGISCGYFYATNNPFIGAIILQLSTILDRCDGEVARIKLKESKFGQWFDTALDQLSYFSMFIGIAICLNNPNYFSLSNINIIIKQFSIINVLLYIIFITTVLFFMIRRTSNGSLAYYPGEVDKRVPIKERSFFYRVISKYRFMLKREFFSPAMIFGSLLGYKVLAIVTLILFIFGLYHQVSDYLALKERTDITY